MKRKKSPDPNQASRFIEAAREAGCSEDEAVFDAALKKIVKAERGRQVPVDSDSKPKGEKN